MSIIRRRRLITAVMGGGGLDSYIKSLAPIAYWPLNETSGTAAFIAHIVIIVGNSA